ncbi:MAG: hypothetical protein ACK40M_01650 [Flavobacteriales bacterium]
MEHFLRYQNFGLYIDEVVSMFQKNGGFISTADVLKTHGEIKMDAVFEKYPDRYFCPESGIKDGRYIRKWIDLWLGYIIKRKDYGYDYFFALKLSHLDLMEIDAFLDFQLENSYNGDLSVFSRFLDVLLRKYRKEIIELSH